MHDVPHRATVRRVGVLPVERSYPHAAGRDEGWVDEFAGVSHALHSTGGVDESEQAVGLASAEAGVESEDRCHGARPATEAGADVCQQALEATGRIGVGEEAHRDRVLGRAADIPYHLGEVCRIVGIAGRSGTNVSTGCAKVKNGLSAHVWRPIPLKIKRKGDNKITLP
jgi:hypothetical protein